MKRKNLLIYCCNMKLILDVRYSGYFEQIVVKLSIQILQRSDAIDFKPGSWFNSQPNLKVRLLLKCVHICHGEVFIIIWLCVY